MLYLVWYNNSRVGRKSGEKVPFRPINAPWPGAFPITRPHKQSLCGRAKQWFARNGLRRRVNINLFFKEEAMKKASKLLYVLLALLLAASFGVLGCGGDDDNGGNPPPPPPPFPTGGDTYAAPSGYAWAWFPYTAADIYPPLLTTVNLHAGDGFEGTAAGGTLIMTEIIVTTDTVVGAKTIWNFTTDFKDTDVDDYTMAGHISNSLYQHTATVYAHGGGFGYPGLSNYSFIGFCVKTDGIGDSRAELGAYAGQPQADKNVKLLSALIVKK
jgi:hypothetical protein